MKWISLILFALQFAFGLEPLADFWSIDTGNLYYIDWAKKGYSKEKRGDILKTIPQRIGHYSAPLAVLMGDWGDPDSTKRNVFYQAAVSLNYKNNATKKRKRVLVWIGRNCELEYYGSRPGMQDTLITWIKKAAPKSMQGKIFSSKECKEILSRSTEINTNSNEIKWNLP